jgi:GAF domain-containing protein
VETEPEFSGARLFAQIAQELAGQDGYAQTAHRVIELAQSLTECDTVSIWSPSQDTRGVVLKASTPPAGDLEALVKRERGGLVWKCLHERATVRVDDFRTDPRWPHFREWAATQSEPVLSAAGFTLWVEDQIVGALVLWSKQPAHFTEHRINVGSIFAEHAAIGLRLASVEDQALNLQEALESNRRIGIALGIIMIEYRVTDQAAFDMLRMVSQNSHRKIRDVAEEVAFTGLLPDIQFVKMA